MEKATMKTVLLTQDGAQEPENFWGRIFFPKAKWKAIGWKYSLDKTSSVTKFFFSSFPFNWNKYGDLRVLFRHFEKIQTVKIENRRPFVWTSFTQFCQDETWTMQKKMKFHFFSKRDQICRKWRICSHLLKKLLSEYLIFLRLTR